MTHPCELIEQPPQPVLSVRTQTSIQELPQVMGQVYPAIVEHITGQGQQPAGAPFVAYYNMDMAHLDLEIGIPVSEALPGQGQIQAGQIPGGRLATCLHVGPYDALAATYEALTAWMGEQGYVPSGVAYEMYLDDPAHTPPEELRTLVVFPLQTG